MSTPETPAPEPDVSVPGDAPVVPVEAAPVVEPVVVPDPAPVAAELQPVDSAGNPILPPVDVVPGDALVEQAVVDVTDPPAVPPAATQILAQAAAPDPVADVTTRAEVSAQQVVDEGSPSPVDTSDAAPVVPVETNDGHTVDASGTADDHQVVAAPVAAPEVEATPELYAAKAAAELPTEAEVLFRAAVRTLAADLGIVRGTVAQWVDEVYGELHGARTSALSSGAVDPYPKLAH